MYFKVLSVSFYDGRELAYLIYWDTLGFTATFSCVGSFSIPIKYQHTAAMDYQLTTNLI